jgi:hypothetical protein
VFVTTQGADRFLFYIHNINFKKRAILRLISQIKKTEAPSFARQNIKT